MTALWTFRQAASHLGVPEAALVRAAEEHGYVIAMGRARRIDPADMEALVEKCRVAPKVQGSTGENAQAAPASGSSVTARKSNRPALRIAEKLKRALPATSSSAGGEVVPLRQTP